jgi:hypothetical protein
MANGNGMAGYQPGGRRQSMDQRWEGEMEQGEEQDMEEEEEEEEEGEEGDEGAQEDEQKENQNPSMQDPPKPTDAYLTPRPSSLPHSSLPTTCDPINLLEENVRQAPSKGKRKS